MVGHLAVRSPVDFESLLQQLGAAPSPRLRDRFEDRLVTPPPEAIRDFVELTFANELDLAIVSPSFVQQHRAELARCSRGVGRWCRPRRSRASSRSWAA